MSTLTPKFKLDRPKSEEKTLIFLKVYVNYKRMTYSVDRNILPMLWNSKGGRAKSVKGDKVLQAELSEINSRINMIDAEVKQLSSYYNHQDITPTPEMLKKALTQKFGGSVDIESESKDLNGYIDNFIYDIEHRKRITGKGTPYKKGTVKNYKGFQTQFTKYQKSIGRKLDFDGVTNGFYDDFIQYFIDKNYQVNTMGRHIKNLKTIMRFANEEGFHKSAAYKKFKVLKEEVVAIYLSFEELEEIYNLDLSGNKDKEIVRDVFLVGAYSALRVSDYTRIQKEHIKKTPTGDLRIDIITQKTDEKVIVPVWHWVFEELLDKYDNEIPYVYPQKINKLMKEIGETAEINEPIEVERLEKGLKVSTKVPKHKLIVTHTARRSGATNMYKHGIETIDIMKITGHKTESAFMSYIRITKEETADRIMKHRIFKPLKVAK